MTGSVTYEGRPLEQGFITFFSVDDRAASRGAKIVNGEFTVTDLPPGTRRALVTTPPDAVLPQGQTKPKLVRPPVVVTVKTPGNNQLVQIRPNEPVRIELKKH